jgi:sugar transferase (PEP-CTERM/EpsH1 system associated)
MKILYLCHRVPFPPNKGDKIRAFHQLRALAEHHEVDVFTLADDPEDLVHQPTLLEICHDVTVARIHPRRARLRSLPRLFSATPLTVPYFYSNELQREVSKALTARSYDRIFVYCSAMAQYVEAVDGIPTVLDLVDVDSDKWSQYARFCRFPWSAIYSREGNALRRFEKRVSEKATCVLVSTEREAQLMREISNIARVHTVPNGVDTEYFKPSGVLPDPVPTLIFTGDMSYFPNQEAVTFFARQVLPIIRRSIPSARFLIVGRNPNHAVANLQQIEGVEVTGFVPDIRSQLARAHVAVAPFSLTAGIPNKILEAMAFGLPVVATSRATQGLSPGAARVVHQGNTAEELASHAIVLLRDFPRARLAGLDGRKQVADDYSWGRAMGRLMELVENPRVAGPPDSKANSSHLLSKA